MVIELVIAFPLRAYPRAATGSADWRRRAVDGRELLLGPLMPVGSEAAVDVELEERAWLRGKKLTNAPYLHLRHRCEWAVCPTDGVRVPHVIV